MGWVLEVGLWFKSKRWFLSGGILEIATNPHRSGYTVIVKRAHWAVMMFFRIGTHLISGQLNQANLGLNNNTTKC